MLKTLLKEVKEYKRASVVTPVFMILEVLMETLIPFLMASIIDEGVNAGNMQHIYKVGGIMVVSAAVGLFAGLAGGRFGAKASAGFAKNLREAMFNHIQSFSFANIDHFSTAGLVTRMTTDVTNVQNAYMMTLRMFTRAPASMICAMVMAFAINARLASIYLVAVIILGTILFFIIRHATAYFRQAFPKYDDLNASVQENVSAIRVVKAYVREEQETSKFQKASENIYRIFVKAERNVIFNAPLMMTTVYTCIILISWLGAKMIISSTLTTGELMSLLAYCMNWITDLSQIKKLEIYVDDPKCQAEFMNIKYQNKLRLAKYIKEHNGIDVDPRSIFDVQVKRLHEYKRQLLNILHVMYLYNQIKEHPEMDFYPRTFIFGAKAAAGYRRAKLTIKLINSVADVINNDKSINGKIKVVFIENYRVSNAEWIFAAADVSEQISTASKEASGTGNMKFMLNGALTLGTMDGANVEIVEEVGAENAFIFGLSSDEVINYEQHGGYDPMEIFNNNMDVRKVLMQLINGTYAPDDSERFREIYDSLLTNKYGRPDVYFILKDFVSYAEAQKKVEEDRKSVV